MDRLQDRFVPLVVSVLDKIRKEMDRLYWNKYQKEMNSPFDNSGEEYSNNTFTVRSYYWGDEPDRVDLPNFEYDGIKVYWYKHSNRGTTIYTDKDLTIDYLSVMLNRCIESLREDFLKRDCNENN